jgi:hypothetical protein
LLEHVSRRGDIRYPNNSLTIDISEEKEEEEEEEEEVPDDL